MTKIKLTTAICLADQPVPQGTVIDLSKDEAASFVDSGLAVYADPSDAPQKDAPPSPTPTSETPSESEAVKPKKVRSKK